MQNSTASPQYQLKHRLVGAVILVAAAVWLIPLLLSPPADRGGADKTPINAAPQIAPEAAAPAAEHSSESRAAVDGWTVRVGTYTHADNRAAVLAKLRANGLDARQTRVQTEAGVAAMRVWLGPYADEKTARQTSARLQKLLGEAGYVVEYSR